MTRGMLCDFTWTEKCEDAMSDEHNFKNQSDFMPVNRALEI